MRTRWRHSSSLTFDGSTWSGSGCVGKESWARLHYCCSGHTQERSFGQRDPGLEGCMGRHGRGLIRNQWMGQERNKRCKNVAWEGGHQRAVHANVSRPLSPCRISHVRTECVFLMHNFRISVTAVGGQGMCSLSTFKNPGIHLRSVHPAACAQGFSREKLFSPKKCTLLFPSSPNKWRTKKATSELKAAPRSSQHRLCSWARSAKKAELQKRDSSMRKKKVVAAQPNFPEQTDTFN